MLDACDHSRVALSKSDEFDGLTETKIADFELIDAWSRELVNDMLDDDDVRMGRLSVDEAHTSDVCLEALTPDVQI